MDTLKLSLIAVAGFLAVGCGGSGAYREASSGGYPSGGEAPAPESPQATQSQPGSGAPQSAPASEQEASAGRSFEPEKDRAPADEERPGLGTVFGESRTSRVSTAPFEREEPARPFAMAQIFYNDEAGVRAMARRSGISHFGDGAFRVAGGALTVRVLDSSGNSLTGFGASGRSYVAGSHGDRYVIQIKNNTGHRVEAVATVDGLDVIDGRSASFHKRGYIVNGFATVEIDGFRRSVDEVAAFRFGSVSGSYAAQKGEDRNVGVIGVAFFDESGSNVSWTNFEVDRRHSADPFPGRFSSPPPGRF